MTFAGVVCLLKSLKGEMMKKLEEEQLEETQGHDVNHEEKEIRRDSNPDPITGEPGSHPAGVGIGGAGGAAAGAAVGGAVGGPVGAVVGGAVGAVAGGLAGKGVAEKIDPTVEEEYWRKNYSSRPYYTPGKKYEDYHPAYRYGWEAAAKEEYRGRKFEDVERQLAGEWPAYTNASNAGWPDVRLITRDAYERIQTQYRDEEKNR
jgi:hypothetical protein